MHILLGFGAFVTLVVVVFLMGWGMGQAAAERKAEKRLARMEAKYQRAAAKDESRVERQKKLSGLLPWRRSRLPNQANAP